MQSTKRAASQKGALIEPSSVLFMIVGPHSGFSLDEIIKMKQVEERRLGYFYWGYAGSLCHPPKVQEFAAAAQARRLESPKVVMVETKAAYTSKTVGALTRASTDGCRFQEIEPGVTLIGCTIAVTCTKLQRSDVLIDMNCYKVAGGQRAGVPMGEYVRYQVNKACAFLDPGPGEVPPRIVQVVAIAELVEPYCVYLAE